MIRIAHGSIEVENTVKSSAGSDPLIDGLTWGFSISAVVVGAFIRSQCSAEYYDSMLTGAFDDLLQTHDEILRAHHFVTKRHLQGRSAIRQSRHHVTPADVVDTL